MAGRPPGPERVAFPLRIEPALLNRIRHAASDEVRSINALIEILLKEALCQRATANEANDTPTRPDGAASG
ncbi:MAG TPA: hypothetical protein DEB63_12265 [Agrobacterium sp.]|uniref:hypothetical protein n=1 Tax=Rhizobium TaxID=379 RepID=UPI000E96EAD4|nr:hypothetical protein [Agrobacterium sp.]